MDNAVPCKKVEPHWLAVTGLAGGLGLFQVPICREVEDKTWVRNPARVARESTSTLGVALDYGVAIPRGVHDRVSVDNNLRQIVRGMLSQPPFSCYAIVDFTRTCLPQLSGEMARDAFAMGYHLGQTYDARCESFPFSPYLGFEGYELSYLGIPWLKPKDHGGKYYTNLRKDYPLLICWRDDDGHTIVHPDYAPK